jgi:hypothetical protein
MLLNDIARHLGNTVFEARILMGGELMTHKSHVRFESVWYGIDCRLDMETVTYNKLLFDRS